MSTMANLPERAPDLALAGFRLWITGRGGADIDDYWDGNWLDVIADCRGSDSCVIARGPLIHLSEIQTLRNGCARLAAGTAQEAGLYCTQPNLKLELWAVPGGPIVGKLRITPDHKAETHDYGFAIERALLPGIVAACEAMLAAYPTRGKAPGGH